jgi:hypothetical protein
VASAVCHFHCGASSRLRIIEDFLFLEESSQKCHQPKKIKGEVKKADQQATEKEKKRWQAIKQRKVMCEEALWEAEGVTYEAGGFCLLGS